MRLAARFSTIEQREDIADRRQAKAAGKREAEQLITTSRMGSTRREDCWDNAGKEEKADGKYRMIHAIFPAQTPRGVCQPRGPNRMIAN